MDLGRLGALRPEGKELAAVTGSGPEHPVLARAHAVISASPKHRSAKSWVSRLARELKPLTETVAAPLVERGVLTEQRSKFLGLFPSTRFPEADPGPERLLRSRLRAVMLGDREPAERDALLLGLLVPLDLVGLVENDQRRAAGKRAKEIAEGGVAGTAVSDAAREIQAAVMVAVMVPVVTGGGSSSSPAEINPTDEMSQISACDSRITPEHRHHIWAQTCDALTTVHRHTTA